MSLYDTIQPYLDKSDAEIAAIPGLMDTPRIVPLSALNEILLASGGWAVLQKIATGSDDASRLASITLGLFQGKLENFDARKTEYRAMLGQVLALLTGYGIDAAYANTINEICGVERSNPTEREIAAARAEGDEREAKQSITAWLAGKYNAAVELIDAGKSMDEVKAFLVA